MFNLKRCIPWTGLLGLACVAFVGCAAKTGVSVTGNAPARYSHVYVTTQELWFNPSATAGPDDTAWIKFTLSAPVTVDLLSATDGTLSQLATALSIPAGTYNQVRLLPVDSTAPLVASAKSLGALFNSEADYADGAGTHQAPLELQNPAQGIGIATALTISNDLNGTFSGNANGTAGTTGTGTGLVNPVDTTGTSTSTGPVNPVDTTGTTATTIPGTPDTTNAATTSATTTSTTTAATVKPVSIAINVDGSRDLVPFTYSNLAGVLLNPHDTAYDAATVGAIQGTLTTSGLTGITASNGRFDITVTAESQSADGTRHIAVNSAPIGSDGTFVLYPLSTTSSSTTSYDLVIHGPAIATVIVKGVTVSAGDPSSTTPVSIGTIALRAASSYTVNLAKSATPLPAGALAGFYQTLPGAGEVPYIIEERPIDPFSRIFATDQAVSAGTIDSGTFASGSAVTLSSAAATEGAASYRVSATAPMFTDGALATKVARPAGNTTRPTLVALPPMTVVSGAASDSMSVAVTELTPGKYDKGDLIVSHDGAIVATAPLDTLLAQGGTGTIVIPGIPGGSPSGAFDQALYFLSVRTWSSANPAGTLNREAYPTAADLRTGGITGLGLSID